MKLKTLNVGRVLAASILLIGVGVTSCKKEVDATPVSEEKKGIETWKTLEDYPSEITMDNWEEFVYAPKEVIAHFVEKERLESCGSSVTKTGTSTSLPTGPSSSSTGPILGLVQFYEGNVENPSLIQFPGVTVSNCDHSWLTNDLQGPYNYILWSCCTSNPTICMEVDQPGTSTAPFCDLTDPLVGVTTLDIVLIQKHILTLEIFTEPAQFIAADVNRDGEVTGADIVTIRKYILGKINSWADSDSYLFIDNSYYNNFDVSNPLNLEILYATDNGNAINPCQHESSTNRIGIKTGDVNGSLAGCF